MRRRILVALWAFRYLIFETKMGILFRIKGIIMLQTCMDMSKHVPKKNKRARQVKK